MRRNFLFRIGQILHVYALAEHLLQKSGEAHAPRKKALHRHGGKETLQPLVFRRQGPDAVVEQGHAVKHIGLAQRHRRQTGAPCPKNFRHGKHFRQDAPPFGVFRIQFLKVAPGPPMGHDQQSLQTTALRIIHEISQRRQEGASPGKQKNIAAHARSPCPHCFRTACRAAR